MPPAETEERIYTVAELTREVKDLLEATFPRVFVAGEISNFSRPQSGHCYFTLKDDQAQIRAVLWRMTASRLRFPIEDGLEVVCRGHLDLYGPRGTYQLVVEEMHPRGIGALELALRRLRDKLAAEGLFEPARKRPLPRFPRRVAFVTSPTGAAIRDFLEVLRRRFHGIEVLVIPARVQGEGAAEEIAAGIVAANRLAQAPDVLVVGRGGGSLEDLWCFNEEVVVRAIAASRIPVISAVGHEIDVTLSDLVADVRALTPSEAAERIAPAMEEVLALLAGYRQRLAARLRGRVERARGQLDALASRRVFRRPLDRIQEFELRLDELAQRAVRAICHRQQDGRRRTDALAGMLESLSPLGVLARGYSMTQRLADTRIVRSVGELQVGDPIVTRFADGEVVSRVERLDVENGRG